MIGVHCAFWDISMGGTTICDADFIINNLKNKL